MSRQVMVSPERAVMRKLTDFPNQNFDEKFSHARYKEIEQEFNRLDKDQNGSLSKTEIANYLEQQGCSPQMIQEIFNDLNTDVDDRISRDEFTHGYLQKEKNIQSLIEQKELQILQTAGDLKKLEPSENKSYAYFAFTIQSGCFSQKYSKLPISEKAKISIDIQIICKQGKQGVEYFSQPALNCEFPLWGDNFRFFLSPLEGQIHLDLELREHNQNQTSFLAQKTVSYNLANDCALHDQLEIDGLGTLEVDYYYHKDYSSYVFELQRRLDQEISRLKDETKNLKIKLHFLQALFGKSKAPPLRIQEQTIDIRQAFSEYNQNKKEPFQQVKKWENSIPQVQQLASDTYPVQQSLLNCFNLFMYPNMQIDEAATISVDLEEIQLKQRFKLHMVLLLVVLLNMAFSRCDYLGLLVLLLALPFKMDWNQQQEQFIIAGMILSSILDIVWLAIYYHCFKYDVQCHVEYTITNTIYCIVILTVLLKVAFLYFVKRKSFI